MFNKKVIILVSFVFLIFGLFGIYSIILETEYSLKNLDLSLKEKVTKDYLDKKILFAIKNDKFDDAVMYHNLAKYLGIALSSETLEEIEKNDGYLSESWRSIKSFGYGFSTGEPEDTMGLVGSITADMTVVGDLRDLSIEGSKFAKDEPYDIVLFGMSAIGVGLSISQFFTSGATTPLKISASIIKAAKKTGNLSKPFVDTISSKLSKAIDFNILKKIDYTSIDSVEKASKQISKSLNSPYIRKAFKNIDTIGKNTDSKIDTIALLKYVDDPVDLQRVADISKKYRKNTKAVFAVLGKGAVKGTINLIKWTNILVTQVLSFMISIIFFLLLW